VELVERALHPHARRIFRHPKPRADLGVRITFEKPQHNCFPVAFTEFVNCFVEHGAEEFPVGRRAGVVGQGRHKLGLVFANAPPPFRSYRLSRDVPCAGKKPRGKNEAFRQ